MDRFISQYFALTVLGIVSLAASALTPIVISFVPRKTLLVTALSIIAMAELGIFTILLFLKNGIMKSAGPYVIAVLFLITTTFHVISPGVIIFIMPTEISPTQIRSITGAVANIFSSLLQALSQFYFYPFFLKLGPYSLLPFIVLMLCCIVITLKYVPETKGLALHEAVNKWRYEWEMASGQSASREIEHSNRRCDSNYSQN